MEDSTWEATWEAAGIKNHATRSAYLTQFSMVEEGDRTHAFISYFKRIDFSFHPGHKKGMSGLTASWFIGIRHALVAMALLATMASGFDFHLHVSGSQEHGSRSHVLAGEPACAHDCSAINVTSEPTDAGVGDWNVEPDHDPCGHCECQISTSGLPFCTENPARTDRIVQWLTPCDVQLRVGVTYQPDPPPVLG